MVEQKQQAWINLENEDENAIVYAVDIGTTHAVMLNLDVHSKFLKYTKRAEHFEVCVEELQDFKGQYVNSVIKKDVNVFEVRSFKKGVGKLKFSSKCMRAVAFAMMKHFNLNQVVIEMNGVIQNITNQETKCS